MARPSGGKVALKLTERKRLDIINAAIEEFQTKGYQSTSMDAIARRAGVSKRTIYNHFPSKDDLFKGVVVSLWERVQQDSYFEYSPETPLRDQLLAIVDNSIDCCQQNDHFALARVILAECVRRPELGKKIFSEIANTNLILLDWIKKACEDGKLKVEHPVIAAHQLDGMIDNFAFWPQVVAGKPPLKGEKREKVLSSVIDMFLSHYQVR
jgi:TetR/AcrR family transcriptional regulator of autoinduction and epiphytic fitness